MGIPAGKSVPRTGRDVKLDPETTLVKVGRIGPIIAIAVSATVLYMQVKADIGEIKQLMAVDGHQRALDRESMTKSMDNLSEQIRRIFVDSVATRQAQQWIENARIANRDKHPEIVWPDLPR